MAVAHDDSVPSSAALHSAVASVSWTHTPVGTAKGIIVFSFTIGASGVAVDTGCTYGGVTVPNAGATYEANDTAGEPGCTRVYFLGDAAAIAGRASDTVVVSRTNNATSSWHASITVTAGANMNTELTGVVLEETDGTLAVVSVTDGSPGTNSQRYGAVNSGLGTPPGVGAGSTLIESLDASARGISIAQETTPGQGARNVGFSSGTSDDRASVYFAVKEVAAPSIVTFEASIAGLGSLGADFVRTVTIATSVAGSGAVAADFVRDKLVLAADIIGQGTLVSDTAVQIALEAGIAGVGALVAETTVSSGGSIVTFESSIVGTGAAVADFVRQVGLEAGIVGAGVVIPDQLAIQVGLEAIVQGVGAVLANLVNSPAFATSISGQGTVAVDITVTTPGGEVLVLRTLIGVGL